MSTPSVDAIPVAHTRPAATAMPFRSRSWPATATRSSRVQQYLGFTARLEPFADV